MQKPENHLLEIRDKAAKRWFFRLFMKFGLGVGTEEAAENALDFNTGGVHAERFQCRV